MTAAGRARTYRKECAAPVTGVDLPLALAISMCRVTKYSSIYLPMYRAMTRSRESEHGHLNHTMSARMVNSASDRRTEKRQRRPPLRTPSVRQITVAEYFQGKDWEG
jgi:hypothetical protein